MRHKVIFIAAFVIFIGVDVWYEIKQCHDWPWPPRFIAAGITFGLLDLFSFVDEDLASVVAVGLVLASLVKMHPWTDKPGTLNCAHSCGVAQPASLSVISSGGTGQIAT